MFKEIQAQLQSHQHLLAVSKLQPLEKVELLFQQGQIHFGENYIQEALEKIKLINNPHLKWHLIGSLQSNKVKFLQKNFEYIHAVDSMKIARLISENAQKINYVQKVFIQINISNEVTKSGFSIDEFEELWPQLASLAHLKIVGLMTMPPLQNEAEQNRQIFRKLKTLADKYHLKELSMGTSHDYKVALSEGSTWIRLGTILFGERTK